MRRRVSEYPGILILPVLATQAHPACQLSSGEIFHKILSPSLGNVALHAEVPVKYPLLHPGSRNGAPQRGWIGSIPVFDTQYSTL